MRLNSDEYFCTRKIFNILIRKILMKDLGQGTSSLFSVRLSGGQSVAQICQMSQKRQCHKSQFRVRFTVFS